MHLLVVDDECSMRKMLAIALRGDGHNIVTAADGVAARRELETNPVDVVISDICMPELDGIELWRWIKESTPETEIILITAHASTDSAIEALRLGAYDYVTKPFDVEELKNTVRNALESQLLRRENVYLRSEILQQHRFHDLVGRSSAMQQVFALIQRVKDSAVTVLITGASGTGKELVARAMHYNSPRKQAAFVTINCAALPATLLESELFGHVTGAFTGAERHKEGLFEAAEGGTLLLDEIGEMPLELQPKLLRVLEDRKVRRLGATVEKSVDVRVLAATNKDLRDAVREGKFREDLYYRLNVIQIELPSLTERREDILLLAEHLLERSSGEAAKQFQGFSDEAERALEAYDWPGNVRELENAIRHAIMMESNLVIGPDSLPAWMASGLSEGPGEQPRAQLPEELIPVDGFQLDSHLDDLKREYMLRALHAARGVQTKAAESLGMSFRSFRYFLKKYELRDHAEPIRKVAQASKTNAKTVTIGSSAIHREIEPGAPGRPAAPDRQFLSQPGDKIWH